RWKTRVNALLTLAQTGLIGARRAGERSERPARPLYMCARIARWKTRVNALLTLAQTGLIAAHRAGERSERPARPFYMCARIARWKTRVNALLTLAQTGLIGARQRTGDCVDQCHGVPLDVRAGARYRGPVMHAGPFIRLPLSAYDRNGRSVRD